MDNPFEEGYQANSAYDNPYWPEYPKKTHSDEQIRAWRWVDGYVQKIIDARNNRQSN